MPSPLRKRPPTRRDPLSVLMASAIAAKQDSDISAAAREKLRSACSISLPARSKRMGCPGLGRRRRWPLPERGPCSIIGTSINAPAIDAVFANSVAGHGLVREDMHTGSVSHLGIVVLPPLLALAQARRVDGRSFAAAAVIGYEVGGRIGRALVTPEFARTFRPTGFTGPLAAAGGLQQTARSRRGRDSERAVACGQFRRRAESVASHRRGRDVLRGRGGGAQWSDRRPTCGAWGVWLGEGARRGSGIAHRLSARPQGARGSPVRRRAGDHVGLLQAGSGLQFRANALPGRGGARQGQKVRSFRDRFGRGQRLARRQGLSRMRLCRARSHASSRRR